MKRSGIRELNRNHALDFVSLHPGYVTAVA